VVIKRAKMNRFYVWSHRIGYVLVLAVIVGCGASGPATGTVQGEVKFDDKPYGDASLILLSMQTGQGGSTNIQSDGKFSLAEPLPVGKYTVYLAPKIEQDSYAEPKPVTIDKTVPSKYWNESESDIQIEVNEGPNNVTIDLKK
jgi:hypothetical protein